MDQNRYTCRNMVRQQPKTKSSFTHVHHKWKYRKKFFVGGGGGGATFSTYTIYRVWPVMQAVSRCLASVPQLRQIRRLVPTATLQMLAVAPVHFRLDYCNALLVGLAAAVFSRCWMRRHGWFIAWEYCDLHMTDVLACSGWSSRVNPVRGCSAVASVRHRDAIPRTTIVGGIADVSCLQRPHAGDNRLSNCHLLLTARSRLLWYVSVLQTVVRRLG